jgi:hypothetical protein
VPVTEGGDRPLHRLGKIPDKKFLIDEVFARPGPFVQGDPFLCATGYCPFMANAGRSRYDMREAIQWDSQFAKSFSLLEKIAVLKVRVRLLS